MAWTIEYLTSAKKQLSKLDRQSARRISDFLEHRVADLADPRSIGESLHGPLRQYWRYRIGDFRVICDIQGERLVVLVVRVGNRGNVYRRGPP